MQKLIPFLTLLVGFVLGLLFFKFALLPKNPEYSADFFLLPTKPLEKYSIENLSNSASKPGKFIIKDVLDENELYNSYLFEFEFNPNLDGKTTKKTTGRMTIPKANTNELSVVLMIRGYVDQENYATGIGTKNAANYFSENGYITIAPDFLGYAGSDKEASNIFESRFQTYTTVLSLLQTLEDIKANKYTVNLPDNSSLKFSSSSPILLWAHSNGGQIALTALEITGKDYPSVLWAPVSKPFPYSILYYTDDADDGGKFLRSKLANFEKLYDTDKYSLTNYFDKIIAPIQLNQGTVDDSVPEIWSNNLTKTLKEKGKEVEYIIYPGSDHNMQPKWNETVANNLAFFEKHTKSN